MKKILIIEDDQIVANVYRNKLAVEGYKAEVAFDGESGLKVMRVFQPDLIILDLMLPTISGVEVIKEIRKETDFVKTPIIVFSNTYLTNLIQDAWRAGANKCLSKSSCSPKDFIDVVRHTIGDSGAIPQAAPTPTDPSIGKTASLSSDNDAAFQADLRKTFIDSLPSALYAMRIGLQGLIKSENEMSRLRNVYDLYPSRPRVERQRRAGRIGADRSHVRRVRGVAQGNLRETKKYQRLNYPHRRRRRRFFGTAI